MEPLNSKIYLVTDVTSALGKAIAVGLASNGGTVIVVAPGDRYGAQAEKEISLAAQSPNVELQLGDLSNLSSVRNLAGILNSKYPRINGLINTTSVYRKQRAVTVDGFEEMIAANYLGPFLLTYLLRDRLAAGSARILNLTGSSPSQLDFEDLQSERGFNSIKAFKVSRTASLLFTLELARRMRDAGVTANAFYPGLVRSEILQEAPAWVRIFAWLFAIAPERAADAIVRAAVDPQFQNMTGQFLNRGEEMQIPDYALDTSLQQRLWELSERLTDAPNQGPNYDPTGSVALTNKRDIPDVIIRPLDEPAKNEHVLKNE